MTARRDAAFAATLAAVLALGVLAVLLLNTSMQQQSRRLDAQRARAAVLAQQMQQLKTVVDLASDPDLLATKARQMDMRPATHVKFLRSSPRPRRSISEQPRRRAPGRLSRSAPGRLHHRSVSGQQPGVGRVRAD